MSQSRFGIKAQDFITSTRKRAHGPMQAILDECSEAERKGLDPPYKVYAWCIFESAEPVPECQVANPEGVDGKTCNCHLVTKGRWENGMSRTFKEVCQGRLARSNGWIPLHDVHKTFRLVSQSVWEAQQECSKPSTEGLVIPHWNKQQHCIRFWEPNPDHGPIFMSVDFGGTNPHAVNWYQLLRYDVDAHGFHQARHEEPQRRLREGTRVCFDEIYRAEIGNNALADLIVRREQLWKERYPSFRVARRFADVQARAARIDLAHHDPPLVTVMYTTRDVKEHVKVVSELVADELFVVDASRCPMFCEEIEAWHYPNKRAGMIDDPEIPVDDFDHCMSNWRYAMANVRVIERQGIIRSGPLPIADGTMHETVRMKRATGASSTRYVPRSDLV